MKESAVLAKAGQLTAQEPTGAFERSLAARATKRALDLATACALLPVAFPLCIVVSVLVKMEDGGPVIFRQWRVGRNGVLFKLRKFRSMRVDAEAETGPTWAQDDDPRVTRLGRWIRALRIDEIPQVWNVLRGEMSFVGPRPERPEFVQTLSASIPFYDQRHAIRPGITGWAQVNLPYEATVDNARQKLEYDLYYLKNFWTGMDVSILLRTIKLVLFSWRGLAERRRT